MGKNYKKEGFIVLYLLLYVYKYYVVLYCIKKNNI